MTIQLLTQCSLFFFIPTPAAVCDVSEATWKTAIDGEGGNYVVVLVLLLVLVLVLVLLLVLVLVLVLVPVLVPVLVLVLVLVNSLYEMLTDHSRGLFIIRI
jgi:fatty acid desaturase